MLIHLPSLIPSMSIHTHMQGLFGGGGGGGGVGELSFIHGIDLGIAFTAINNVMIQ